MTLEKKVCQMTRLSLSCKSFIVPLHILLQSCAFHHISSVMYQIFHLIWGPKHQIWITTSKFNTSMCKSKQALLRIHIWMAMTSYKSFNAIETYFVKYFLEAVCSAQFMGRCTNMVKRRECYHKRTVTSCRHLACWLAPDWITGLAKGMLGSFGRWKDLCNEMEL